MINCGREIMLAKRLLFFLLMSLYLNSVAGTGTPSSQPGVPIIKQKVEEPLGGTYNDGYDGGAVEIFKDGYNSWFFGSKLNSFLNIYSDPKAQEIDQNDYRDFVDKLSKIVKLWGSLTYKEISLRALTTTLERISIERVLKEYYGKYAAFA